MNLLPVLVDSHRPFRRLMRKTHSSVEKMSTTQKRSAWFHAPRGIQRIVPMVNPVFPLLLAMSKRHRLLLRTIQYRAHSSVVLIKRMRKHPVIIHVEEESKIVVTECRVFLSRLVLLCLAMNQLLSILALILHRLLLARLVTNQIQIQIHRHLLQCHLLMFQPWMHRHRIKDRHLLQQFHLRMFQQWIHRHRIKNRHLLQCHLRMFQPWMHRHRIKDRHLLQQFHLRMFQPWIHRHRIKDRHLLLQFHLRMFQQLINRHRIKDRYTVDEILRMLRRNVRFPAPMGNQMCVNLVRVVMGTLHVTIVIVFTVESRGTKLLPLVQSHVHREAMMSVKMMIFALVTLPAVLPILTSQLIRFIVV